METNSVSGKEVRVALGESDGLSWWMLTTCLQ